MSLIGWAPAREFLAASIRDRDRKGMWPGCAYVSFELLRLLAIDIGGEIETREKAYRGTFKFG